MAHKGFLRMALNKSTKKGSPFVSALIVKDPTDTEGGDWFSIFDAWWFGGTDEKPSPNDIRGYASKDAPTEVVYEFTENEAGFKNITAIRPTAEKWTSPSMLPPVDSLLADEGRDTGVEARMGAAEFLAAAREHLEAAVVQVRAAEASLK